ncbi:MAG: MFS transporter [Eubacteriaceae bacterium]|nr:MFS transporter [Eubacteriaceae bacterium]
MKEAKVLKKNKNRFPALKEKNFRYFWVGHCISLIGTWMQRTALQWLVYSLTKSPLLLGLLGVAQFAPMLLFSLFAGVFIDRMNKKKVLMITQSALMLLAFLLAYLVITEKVQYIHIIIIAVSMGFVNTLDMPTRQSFIPELVKKENIINAVALNSSVVNVARIFGPAIAGFIMLKYGPGVCFLLNGVSFIAVLFGMSQIKITSRISTETKRIYGSVFSELKEGLNYIRSNKAVLASVLSLFAVGTFSMNSDVIIPPFVKLVLLKGASDYSMLLSLMAIGSFTAAISIAAKARSSVDKKILYGSAVLLCLSQISMVFVKTYFLSALLLAIVGFFTIAFANSVLSTIQLSTTNEYRGRVMSVYSLAFNGTTPAGNLFAGAVTETFGPNIGFFSCGFAALIFILMIMNRFRVKS